MQPNWTHDCEHCRFLGAMYNGGDLFDWYACKQSVVARYGNDGPEYWSSLRSIVDDDKYLNVSGTVDGMYVLARFMLSQQR